MTLHSSLSFNVIELFSMTKLKLKKLAILNFSVGKVLIENQNETLRTESVKLNEIIVFVKLLGNSKIGFIWNELLQHSLTNFG